MDPQALERFQRRLTLLLQVAVDLHAMRSAVLEVCFGSRNMCIVDNSMHYIKQRRFLQPFVSVSVSVLTNLFVSTNLDRAQSRSAVKEGAGTCL